MLNTRVFIYIYIYAKYTAVFVLFMLSYVVVILIGSVSRSLSLQSHGQVQQKLFCSFGIVTLSGPS